MSARAGAVDKDGFFIFKKFDDFFDREKFFSSEKDEELSRILEAQKRANNGG